MFGGDDVQNELQRRSLTMRWVATTDTDHLLAVVSTSVGGFHVDRSLS